MPEEQNRRVGDDIITRLSVLEERQKYGLEQVAMNHQSIVNVMERLDEHITRTDERFSSFMQASSDRHSQMSIAIAENTTTLRQVDETMDKVSVAAFETKEKVDKFGAVCKTIGGVATILSVLVGAAWAVFTYFGFHLS